MQPGCLALLGAGLPCVTLNNALSKAMEAYVPKGNQKSNREVRKPKKQKSAAASAATVTSTFATPSHKSGQKR